MVSRTLKKLIAEHKTLAADILSKQDGAKTAVVVGGAAGIGGACAKKLAGAGFSVIAVGRDKPGRAEAVIAELDAKSAELDPQPKHEFRVCDAFSLKDVKNCADSIVKDHGSIDAVVLSQGMATTQGFTPTAEGNDEKITLHLWSRVAFSNQLLPSLRESKMPGGPVVISILSGGVHGAFKGYKEDPELKNTYSIKNAADMAGYYNDLIFDVMAKETDNRKINFIHASPGFVNSNWGTEMPFYLKAPIRMLQPLGKSTKECAEFMADPILKAAAGKPMMERPGGSMEGVFIMDQHAAAGSLTKQHTEDALESVWKTAKEVLGRAGINLD
uniref:Protochlorophyllide reductase n=1 Tax=Helicotheca tamesis TaxID=374047 RepID=A0A7S2HP88_9STRA